MCLLYIDLQTFMLANTCNCHLLAILMIHVHVYVPNKHAGSAWLLLSCRNFPHTIHDTLYTYMYMLDLETDYYINQPYNQTKADINMGLHVAHLKFIFPHITGVTCLHTCTCK